MAFNEKIIKNILERLDKLEARVANLEALTKPTTKPVKPTRADEFVGLSGGINRIIRNGFLKNPKSVDEIKTELERLGYYYSFETIATILRRDFMKKKQILTRIRKDKKWFYVLKR